MPNPPDYNTYTDPPPSSVELSGFPRMMYHPTNPPQVVNDQNSAANLIASDSQWSFNDPNATT